MKKNGFSVIELIIVVATVVLLGAVGYVVYDKFYGQTATETAKSVSAEDLPVAPEIETVADLGEAIQTIDSVDLDSSDSILSDLQAELDKF